MKQYLELLDNILTSGIRRRDRTGVGTFSVFGRQLRLDLNRQTLPLLTTKKINFNKVVHEMIWFLRGERRVDYLRANGVGIWEPWTPVSGDLGPIYGYQWRHWRNTLGGEIDQIKELVDGLKTNPDSRRHIVSAWNVADLPEMALPPCHLLFQCYVSEGQLSLQLYQRSADVFIGLPFNIASYATLTHLLAQVTGLVAKELVITLGDAHVYLNHLDQVAEQLSRAPRASPKLWVDPTLIDIDTVAIEHFRLEGYDPHPAIRAPVAV